MLQLLLPYFRWLRIHCSLHRAFLHTSHLYLRCFWLPNMPPLAGCPLAVNTGHLNCALGVLESWELTYIRCESAREASLVGIELDIRSAWWSGPCQGKNKNMKELALCHRQQHWFISLCFLIFQIFFSILTPFDFHGNSREKLGLNFARWTLWTTNLTLKEKMRWHCWEAEKWDIKSRACDF